MSPSVSASQSTKIRTRGARCRLFGNTTDTGSGSACHSGSTSTSEPSSSSGASLARRLDQSQSRETAREIRLRAVHRDDAAHLHGLRRARIHVRIFPVELAARAAREITDRDVVGQIVRRAWRAVPREIRGRRAIDLRELADAPCDQRRVRQHADPHRAVDAVGDEVDEAVGRAEHHAQVGIACVEILQRRNHLVQREAFGQVDADHAARRRTGVVEQRLGIVEIGQQPRTALVVGGALGGQRDAPGGPLQQPHAQVLLQILDGIADGGAWQLQLFGRFREAAEVGDARKDAHCMQMVHAGWVRRGNSLHC